MNWKMKQARYEKRLNQYELAAMLGISQASLSLIELGHREPSPKVAQDIARAVGVPQDKLFPSVGAAAAAKT